MFNIVLVHPQIPPNTGNVIRLAANTGCTLHLIEPLGFEMQDRLLRRAGLDYHEYAAVHRHASWAAWLEHAQPDLARCFAFSTRGEGDFSAMRWRAGDWLVFGSESAGLPATLLERIAPTSARATADAPRPTQPEPEQCGRGGGVRSLAAERLRRQRLSIWHRPLMRTRCADRLAPRQCSTVASRDISWRIACTASMRPSSTPTTAWVIGISTPRPSARASTTGAL